MRQNLLFTVAQVLQDRQDLVGIVQGFLILPQTAKSSPVEIASVRLMNVSEGG